MRFSRWTCAFLCVAVESLRGIKTEVKMFSHMPFYWRILLQWNITFINGGVVKVVGFIFLFCVTLEVNKFVSVFWVVLSLVLFLLWSILKTISIEECRWVIMGWYPAVYFQLTPLAYISTGVAAELSRPCTPYMILICEQLWGGRYSHLSIFSSSFACQIKRVTGNTATNNRWNHSGIYHFTQLRDNWAEMEAS